MSQDIVFDYKYGFSASINYVYKSSKGLTKELIEGISKIKKEPEWMRLFRLKSFQIFLSKPMPSWGPDLSEIDFSNLVYYAKPTESQVKSWKDLPEEIKKIYDKIGVPEAERDFLAGVSAQFDSEVVYERMKREIEKLGVIFCDMDTAVKKYPKIVKEYFGKLVPPNDNKFAALNSAVWSGGSFVYVPAGVKVPMPLQAYFRINAQNFGQFERTLIIAEEGSYVQYLEGCTAPIYTTASLHAGVVEVFVKKGARVRYTTVQNWSHNVYNLVTKRARVEENGVMEWVDVNVGSKVTMKYPACVLAGKGAKGEVLSIAYASEAQIQDSGAKMIHAAPFTSSRIISKSISRKGGRTSYRGLVHISPSAEGALSFVSCDALLLDADSRSDTYPHMRIKNQKAKVQHEATVERVGEEKLFYLASRGIKKEEAEGLLVNGFVEPVARELPLSYAVELNRLLKVEMEGSVG